jgi:branched-chain amino acid aminotransferase
MEFINVNGEILEAGRPYIRTDDHSYRYGDGLFETMKVQAGKILLFDFHYERLSKSLSLLQFHIPEFLNRRKLEEEILNICRKNNCEELARVRFSVSRGNGGLYDNDQKFQYAIECSPLDNINARRPDNKDLLVDIFPYARKSCDIFSNLKSANFLPYVMAARFAKENKLSDCLLLNSHERICDSTIANIFWVKEEKLFTPPLSEGCIDGVMRRYLIESARETRYRVHEKVCEIKDMEHADEVFLTNAIAGIRRVTQFRSTIYSNNNKICDGLLQNFSGRNNF